MFLSDKTMKLLMELDAPTAQKVELLTSMREDEEAAGATQRRRGVDRDRQAKHRAKPESENVTEDAVTKRDNAENSGCHAEPLSLPPSPQTPQPPTHTRVSVISRERTREDAAFDRFWVEYPRKTAKAEARKAFSKAWRELPPHDEEAILVGGLERAKAGWTDAQFIPHAATWLRGARWNDEPPTVTPLRPYERPHPDDKLTRKQANLARAFAGSQRASGFRGEP